LAKKRLIEVSIWQDSWFLGLTNEEQRMFLFLLTSNYLLESGFCEIPKIVLKTYFGHNFTKIAKKLKPKVYYDEEQSLFFIVNFAGKNTKSPNILKAISNDLIKYKDNYLINVFVEKYSKYLLFKDICNGYERVSKPSNDNEYEYDNDCDNEEDKEKKHKYGEYKNVLLTDTQLKKLQDKFKGKTNEVIKNLDEGIEMKGYKYNDHYLAILKWNKENIEQEKTDYSAITSKFKIEKGE